MALLRAQIVELLRGHPLRAIDVSEALGRDYQTVMDTMKDLVRDGYLRRQGFEYETIPGVEPVEDRRGKTRGSLLALKIGRDVRHKPRAEDGQWRPGSRSPIKAPPPMPRSCWDIIRAAP